MYKTPKFNLRRYSNFSLIKFRDELTDAHLTDCRDCVRVNTFELGDS